MRYVVTDAPSSLAPHERALVEGATLRTGKEDFEKSFKQPTTLETDMLRLAAAIFAADRATPRGQNEDLARHIEVEIPVVNLSRFQGVAAEIESLLHTLSNDYWRLEFATMVGQPEGGLAPKLEAGETLLFSGGLDSLAAAIEFGKKVKPLQLVSHRTKNQPTTKAQNELVKLLAADGYNLIHRPCVVSSSDSKPSTFDHDIENSQRTRSFVFLVLGALYARRAGHEKLLYLAENGQMAIHLSLTAGRIGALSTHTAHPDVLTQMETILRLLLDYQITIQNPYVYKTKREVVSIVWHGLRKAVPISTSCWKNSRLAPPATHCGACIPCYVRRIAIEHHGTDPTQYAEDPWGIDPARLPEDSEARRNIYDLAEFIFRFKNATDTEIQDEYPELLAADFDVEQVIKMYRRFAVEAEKVWEKYPGPISLLA